MTKVVASVEARMGSSRLPGKMLMDVGGKSAIGRVCDRLRQCSKLDGVVLATSVEPADDMLADWAHANGVECYRGSQDDVLDRVLQAQKSLGSDVVVEVTGDCVLLDPQIIDLGIESYFENDCDVATNVTRQTFPIGIDVQVFAVDALDWVARNVDDPDVREHVSLHFYRNPDKYRILTLLAPREWAAPEFRLVLDYEADLDLMRKVYSALEPECGSSFGVGEIIRFLRKHPEIAAVNSGCVRTVAK